MKIKLLPLLTLLLSISFLQAQTTVTSSAIPSAGATLETKSTTTIGSAVVITAPGPNQVWDFSSETSGSLRSTVVQTASSSVFTNADIEFYNYALNGQAFFNTTSNTYEMVGFSGDFLGIGTVFDIVFSDAETFLETPMNYQDNYMDNSAFGVQVKTSDYPSLDTFIINILSGALPPNVDLVVDSVRVTFSGTADHVVDAWGSLSIAGENGTPQTYDVLREKTIRITDTKIEMLGSVFGGLVSTGWIDPTNPPPSLNIPAISVPFAGVDTVVTYDFRADGSMETIATVVMDSTGNNPQAYEYKRAGTTSTFGLPSVKNEKVRAYPNPVVDNLNLELTGFKAGSYQLKIFNIIGVPLYTENFEIRGKQTKQVDVSNFAKGTYLYSIIDNTGRTVTTKRVMIVKP